MQHDDDADDFGGEFDGDFDLDEILGDSNAGAYQRVEERTGPPLEYVAEKSRNTIEAIHTVHAELSEGDGARGSWRAC
jgi:hypothetical protein